MNFIDETLEKFPDSDYDGIPDNIDTDNIFATELDAESNYVVLKFNTDIKSMTPFFVVVLTRTQSRLKRV